MNLDGTDRTPIVTNRVSVPNGLALDFELDRLYWCDAYYDNIQYVDFEGRFVDLFVYILK